MDTARASWTWCRTCPISLWRWADGAIVAHSCGLAAGAMVTRSTPAAVMPVHRALRFTLAHDDSITDFEGHQVFANL
ncbi:hypothetical protein ACVIN2_006783 [Bradyrhizobium sp. USDA 3650]